LIAIGSILAWVVFLLVRDHQPRRRNRRLERPHHTTKRNGTQAVQVGVMAETIESLTRERDTYKGACEEATAGAFALIAERDSLRAALRDLLEDTQHKNHNCGDDDCPVKRAREAIKSHGEIT
jgi:hypothetical protein